MREEAYGSAAQCQLMLRGRAMYDLLQDDPRFDYYGRTVGAQRAEDVPLGTMLRLATLQGASHYSVVPNADIPALKARAEEQGFNTTIYRRWSGGAGAVAAARSLLETAQEPNALHRIRMAPDTPAETLDALAEAAGSVGVMTLAGDILRGIGLPSVTLAFEDSTGRIVSCASSARQAHAAHPTHGSECWWGMLATRQEARGARLSLLLGAQVLLEMHDTLGFTRFFTGVQEGNEASEAICARMGLALEDASVLSVVDPEAMPGGRITR